MDLQNPFKQEQVENNLKSNIVSRFEEVVSKPKIAVKSFAKISCLGNLVNQGETQEELFQNPEGVTESDTIVTKKLIKFDPLDISSDQDPSSSSINITNLGLFNRHNKVVNTSALQKCPKPSQQPEGLRKANAKCLNESIFCDLCNQTFKNSVDFSLHSIKHNNNEKYNCHVCKYKTSSEKFIKRHVQSHERKTHNCEICKKSFRSKGEAAAHKHLHTGEKPLVCDICGINFSLSTTFYQHRRDRHWKTLNLTPPIYDCKICEKKYTSATGLNKHFKRHHVQGFDESELCDICGKRLSCKKHLKIHRRIHTGYKPNACNICSKRFSKKELLIEHMRVHSGEKPFKCKHCSKCFTQRSSRTIHERSHTGERPYICRLCNRGFISKSALDMHIKKCDGVKQVNP